MINIPLHIRKLVGEEKFIFLPMIVKSGMITGIITFLVDTGSPFTVICPTDLQRFRVPLKRLAKQKGKTFELAGHVFKKFPLGDISFSVKTDNNSNFSAKSSVFCMATPTKVNKKTLKNVKNIPSILGNDFLVEQKAGLFYHPSKNEASLMIG